MSASEKHKTAAPVPSALPEATETQLERLWAPWRMRYVAKTGREDGCIFCDRLAEDDDVETLILHRGERAFVIMNLFPYNTGHVMIVPNAHVASPESAEPKTMAEMAMLRGPVLRALRRALGCEGFNLGLNIGAVAGAGVAEHLHEHVVPRWQGDANFMPILAATKVMPELIPVTYAKLRAEMEREFGGAETVRLLVLTPDARSVLVDAAGSLPEVRVLDDESDWRAAICGATELGARDAEVIGWAGESRAGSGPPALALRATLPEPGELSPGYRIGRVADTGAGPLAATTQDALRRLASFPESAES